MAVYRWVEHTSEVELAIEAQSPEKVFGDALAGLAELLADRRGGEQPARAAGVTRRVSVAAPDLPALLVEWLNELIYLAEADGLIPERIERFDLIDGKLEAVVEGRLGEPPSLVKGATYHRLEMREDRGVWHARVVLDV